MIPEKTSLRDPLRVLVCAPDLDGPGGVAAYWLAIKDSLTVAAEFIIVGRRPHQKMRFFPSLRALGDVVRFSRVLTRGGVDLVHLNPSLNFKAVARDALLLIAAKAFRVRVLVFFHGWEASFQRSIEKYLRRAFHAVFSRADGIVVLSSDFKIHLRAMGLKNPVFVETTSLRNEVFDYLGSAAPRTRRESDGRVFEILFLSRVERYKGIGETVEAYRILRSRSDRVRLTVAGAGDGLEAVERYVREEKIEGVTFAGHLVGESKAEAFLRSDVYVLPSYGEGMPISVLEAMAFGVPVVVTRTGGLRDFFQHGKMGFLVDTPDPELISDFIQTLMQDRALAHRMSRYNRRYARDRFAASRVAGRLEEIYRCVGCDT